jgi:probable rRNA maturation factor
VFCEDDRIRALNRDYRGLDRPTDVLSFAQESPPFRHRPVVLGDVVISVPTAARQAQAAGHSLARELEWLLLHGVLHLLGRDDETEAGLRGMIARQEQVLAALAGSPERGPRPPASAG